MSKREKTKPADADQPEEQPGQADTIQDGDGEAAEQELSVEEQLAEMTDRWLRTRADAENTRRRARLDVEEARKHGASSLIQSLLPVLDSLQRALAAKPEGEGANDTVWEGLELTEQMLLGTLAAHGVTPIDSSPGSAFDPNTQQALLEQPTSEQEPGTVLMELVRGYRLHDRLLREAQVTVATRPKENADQDAPHQDTPDADV